MSTVPKETVNISFLRDLEEKNRVLQDNSTPEQRYIILMNDELHVQNRDLLKRVSKLEDQVEEFEDEQGQTEVRRNNMKGLLKNFHEMNKWHKEVSEKQGNVIQSAHKDVQHFRWRATKHLRILEACLLVFLAVCYENYSFLHFLPVFACLLVVVSFQESTLQNIPPLEYKTQDDRIKVLLKEIQDTMKAQDYIHDFLDQQ